MKLSIHTIESLLINAQNEQVILDRDVAQLYGVLTKRINEAVKNNPDKFPDGFLITFNKMQWDDLWTKISTANFSKQESLPKPLLKKDCICWLPF